MVISDPEASANVIGDTSHIIISGETAEAMKMSPMTLFVYGDRFNGELLATCRIEVHSRPLFYSTVTMGHWS